METSPPSPLFRPPHRAAGRAPGAGAWALQSRGSRALGQRFPLQTGSAVAQLTFPQASGPASTSLSQRRCQQSEGHRRFTAHNTGAGLPPPHPAALQRKPSSAFRSPRKLGCQSWGAWHSWCHHPGSGHRGNNAAGGSSPRGKRQSALRRAALGQEPLPQAMQDGVGVWFWLERARGGCAGAAAAG